MKVRKESIALFSLSILAFLGAFWGILSERKMAGMTFLYLCVMLLFFAFINVIKQQKKDIRQEMLKNMVQEKEELRDIIQKQEKELAELQDALAESFVKLVNGQQEKDSLSEYGIAGEEKTEIALHTIAREVAEKFTPFAKKAGIHIRVSCEEEGVIMQAAPSHIRIILSSILENALKYMNREGVVVITISKIEEQVFLVIKDNGEGIGKEETERIFDKFFQGKNTFSGFGMGLAAVKAIVQSYQGTVYARSEPGKGMAVYIILPEK